MAKAKRIKPVYGEAKDYEKAVKDGLIIPRTPSTPSDDLKQDYKDGKIVARPGMPNTNLANLDFSQEALLTKYADGRQETAARKYYEANIDQINRVRKTQGLAELTVDECVAAAKAVYDILNDKGKANPELKEAMDNGLIVERYPVEELGPPSPSLPTPPSAAEENKKENINFSAKVVAESDKDSDYDTASAGVWSASDTEIYVMVEATGINNKTKKNAVSLTIDDGTLTHNIKLVQDGANKKLTGYAVIKPVPAGTTANIKLMISGKEMGEATISQ